MTRAAVLWTGGKDSMLALEEAAEADAEIDELITFVPEVGSFRAHPLARIREQAARMRIAHRAIPIARPYDRGYRAAFDALRVRGTAAVVTGDIDRVDGQENWVRTFAESEGLEVRQPLWGRPRGELLAALVSRGIRATVTYVHDPRLGPSWVGRGLDAGACRELEALHRTCGIDASGEQGEYHSMVTFARGFHAMVGLPEGAPRFDGYGWHLPW